MGRCDEEKLNNAMQYQEHISGKQSQRTDQWKNSKVKLRKFGDFRQGKIMEGTIEKEMMRSGFKIKDHKS